jgi:nucleoside-diphosphate-sugar epimerase
MKVLVTGAFGNVGTSAVLELWQRGHTLRLFDLATKANREAARRYGCKVEVVWGDIRRREDIEQAVQGQDAVVHLAFIIPKLSRTKVESEREPELAREVNVGGTANLIAALEAMPSPPRLLFASSCHVYGATQHLPPPRTVSDEPRPKEHYARHKLECEELLRRSRLQWCILRLAAALPLALILDPGMFDVPLDNRIEFIHTRDVGLAIANALESQAVWGRILLIGGGPSCQFYYRQIVERVLDALGVGMLPESAFAREPFGTDWLDTAESQALLRYQTRTLDDYIQDMRRSLGLRRFLLPVARPFVRYWLLKRSPYLPRHIKRWREAWALR